VSKSLASGDALGVERELMRDVWKRLTRVADREPFRFAQVFAFVFKWDIVRRWRAYDAQLAAERFQVLIEEVTREHQPLFR